MNRLLVLPVLLCACGGAAFEPGLDAPGDASPAADEASGSFPETSGLFPERTPDAAPDHAKPEGATADAGATELEATPDSATEATEATEASAPDAAAGDEPPPPPPPKDAAAGPPEASACSPAPAETLPCGSARIAAPGLYCHATAVNLSLGQWSYSPQATPPACQCAGAFDCACLEDAGLCQGQVFHCTDLDGGGPSPWCS